MRAVAQRVLRLAVHVDGVQVSSMGAGVLALVGVERGDAARDALWLAERLVHLRIFTDAEGRMNHSLLEAGGSLGVVSQFTLLGDCRKGRRPSFGAAEEPAAAADWIESVAARARALGAPVITGVFRAHMQLELINDGPVTLLLDSRQVF
jgi:D-tyrosyl-tRNA(Tyr) deacylase